MRFAGHAPLRPLLEHPADPRAWTVPVDGDDAYDVAVGPIHAGVIESGHFRFHVVGERILHLDARLFYKHRGLERPAEGRSLDDGLRVWSAPARPAPSATRSRTRACEAALGLGRTPALDRVRDLLLELERRRSHLNDIAAVCAGVGFAAGNELFAALTDRARGSTRGSAGHRFLRGTVALGAARWRSTRRRADGARRAATHRREARAGWRELTFNRSFQDRLGGVGVLTADDVARLGATGPAARAAGVAEDARARPRLAYPASRRARRSAPRATSPRAWSSARWSCGSRSSSSTRRSTGPSSRSPRPGGDAQRLGVARIESPRGATTCTVARRRRGSRGFGCAPARTPTGPPSRTPRPATCCPTSR